MRIAVVSDIHGNITALEAVISDLREASPDLIVHGGDLADSGSSPVEVVDRIRSLGWDGVKGNTDQMLSDSESLESFAKTSKAPALMWAMIREMASVTRARLGAERLEWLRSLSLIKQAQDVAVVHASPGDCWRAPGADASDEELQSTYREIETPVVVFGHIHKPFVRLIDGAPHVVANSGSVGLPYDGDPRASYLLLDNGQPTIKRVEYEIAREIKLLSRSSSPGAEWIARMLKSGTPQMP
jgi:putative phosphoesterase